MAHDYHDRVKQLTTTQGTGSYTLGSAVAGYRTFGDVMEVGDTTTAVVVNATLTAWELIEVELINSTTLARGTVLANSLGNTAKIDWPDNAAKEILCAISGKRAVTTDRTNTYTADQLFKLAAVLFGANGLSSVSGTDTAVRLKVGANVTLELLASGDVRLLLGNDDGSDRRALILQVDSASPANGDWTPEVSFRMNDDDGNAQTFGRIRVQGVSVEAGAWSGLMDLSVGRNGAITPGLLVNGSTGEIRAAPGFNLIAGAG